MRLSIITCASARIELFDRHIESLASQDAASECEYNVCIWGPPEDHNRVLIRVNGRFKRISAKVIEADCWWPLPKAYNAALGMATGERLLIIGSDVIADGGLLAWAAMRTEEDVAWCCRVVNGNAREFVGPSRRVAIPYCLTVARQKVLDMRGWSEAFCDGTCYDDNDFAARLLLAGVTYRWCDKFVNTHQPHAGYGGNQRRLRNDHNRQVWLKRLGGYTGSLWPVQWIDGQSATPADMNGAQSDLRTELRRHGYPLHGDFNACR